MPTDHDSHEPPHASSPTAYVIDALDLHGYHPAPGELDLRPMPEPLALRSALADVFDALVSSFADTPLERDLDRLLWSQVQVFHRLAETAQRDLDDNEDAQRRSQREQDGSEVRSVELERLGRNVGRSTFFPWADEGPAIPRAATKSAARRPSLRCGLPASSTYR